MYCESQLVMDGTRAELHITPGCEQIIQDEQAVATDAETYGFPILLGISENHKDYRTSFLLEEVRCEVAKGCIDIDISKTHTSGLLAHL